jgi:hypothetical protein
MECLLLTCTTAANGSEREQISPLLDSVRLKPGRPKKRVRVLAADKGYDSKEGCVAKNERQSCLHLKRLILKNLE